MPTSLRLPSIAAMLALAAVALADPPPTPPPLPSTASVLRAAVATEPGGTAPLSPDGETVVDPGASFAVELASRIPDARLVLVDATDAHVPAAATRDLGAGTRLSLSPAAPLVPGSRYALRVDGAATRELHDADGRAYAPISFTLLAAGTPPPPAPKKKPKRARRR